MSPRGCRTPEPNALAQSRGVWTCAGRCGNAECTFVSTNATRIKYHVRQVVALSGTKRIACRYCDKRLQKRSLLNHHRIFHPDHPLPYERKSVSFLPCPVPEDRPGWNFVKHKIRLCIANDARAMHRWSTRDQVCVREQHASNQTIHDLAKRAYARWKAMCDRTDDAGGKVPGGVLLLRRHALFQLSLDRIDNTRPHFVQHTLTNLNFVPLGLNTPKGVVGRWGKDTCRRLRACVDDSNTALAARRAAAVMQRARGAKGNKNAVYRSTARAYRRDTKTQRQFGSTKDFFAYTLQLLATQRGRCAVSGIVMDEGPHTPHSQAFQPSLDAICPKRGHVQGNLRWICCFLNNANQSKQRSCVEETRQLTVHTEWTPALFRAYIQAT